MADTADVIYLANPTGAVTVRDRPTRYRTDNRGRELTDSKGNKLETADYERLRQALHERRVAEVKPSQCEKVDDKLNKAVRYVLKPNVVDQVFPTLDLVADDDEDVAPAGDNDA